MPASRYVTTVWRAVLLFGVGIAVCAVLTIAQGFADPPLSTAVAPSARPSRSPAGAAGAFVVTVLTTDRKFAVTLAASPNRAGTNVFMVSVIDMSTGTLATDVGISLSTTMLDMRMGTALVPLHPDGNGHFSGHAELAMGGDWRIRMQIRTSDRRLHEATVNLLTPG